MDREPAGFAKIVWKQTQPRFPSVPSAIGLRARLGKDPLTVGAIGDLTNQAALISVIHAPLRETSACEEGVMRNNGKSTLSMARLVISAVLACASSQIGFAGQILDQSWTDTSRMESTTGITATWGLAAQIVTPEFSGTISRIDVFVGGPGNSQANPGVRNRFMGRE
jgi:hypothetical protein